MKTDKELYEMIVNRKQYGGTHGLTYQLAHLLQFIEHDGIKEKMIDLNHEYNQWIDNIVDEHFREK